MNKNGGLVINTIEIAIERDEQTGSIYVKGNYKDLPIDMLYEAMKFMSWTARLVASARRAKISVTLRSCASALSKISAASPASRKAVSISIRFNPA